VLTASSTRLKKSGPVVVSLDQRIAPVASIKETLVARGNSERTSWT
jgi:hypothetical protein